MIIIALGGNRPFQGRPPEITLLKAIRALPEKGDVAVVARSGLWRSPAWPDPADPPYANAAARIETSLAPEALMTRLLEVEKAFGRDRAGEPRWCSRTLDLDLIDYDGRTAGGEHLTLPHPRAHERAFVLAPVMDIAPEWSHPAHGRARSVLESLPGEAREGLSRLRLSPSQTHKRS
ncbi:2-amino-4-hydroxy-6-hydroxymethyldihydropteridine diphosphokinase [Euryhalocaulis caribicus]|uniref:2-amino-4-hydroxy-6- hydroxymethyldihydropteridine diphosphokinase n=1 Tax=Euryhalocaulis caribicus TaxID=1161401 RepID=UPI0003A0A8B9|nr:2-amino-4-hydroxy-6-hydroxymethyldihydropteridine diphosphokinase [Euryhalocaulis caribicus]